MPGLQLTTTDARTVPGAKRLILPSTLNAGLAMLHLLTDGLAAAQRSWVDGVGPASLVGAPVAHDGYVTCTAQSAYLRTSVLDLAAGTLAVVARTSAPAGLGPTLLSNYGGEGHVGSSILMFNGAATGVAAYAPSGGSVSVADPGANDGSWQLLLSDFDGTGVRIHNATAGRSAASAAGARVTNGLAYCIGSGADQVFSGSSDIMLAAAWSRVLTGAERTAFYAWAQAVAASFEITV